MPTLVIARYNEKLDWLLQVPPEIRIVVYNKGEPITDPAIIARLERIETRRNFGREAETYLHHLMSAEPGDGGDFTIFCQGDPFPHSPDFLKLLDQRDGWQEVQPLTLCWLRSHQIPPDLTLANEQEEYLHRLRVRSEIYSVHTWSPTRFHDDGAMKVGRDYLSGHQLPPGTNIAAHFLRSGGWNELAIQADTADFGQSCHGAIFAVRNERLAMMPRDVAAKYHLMSRTHPLYGWIFERLWLHFFGLPFHPQIVRHELMADRLPRKLRPAPLRLG